MPRGARPGERRGGRAKGTKNKRTLAFESGLEAALEQMGADPHRYMAEVMLNTDLPHALRFQAARELAQYLAPKRKAIEHSGQLDIVQKLQSLNEATDEELDQIIAWAEDIARKGR